MTRAVNSLAMTPPEGFHSFGLYVLKSQRSGEAFKVKYTFALSDVATKSTKDAS